MSWQQWSAAPPSVVPGITALSAVVNPAPAVMPAGSQYTPEQWTQMQQQNWQQWAQWQQQYQQWHQQYGAEYQKSLSALSQTAGSNIVPAVANTSVPPPLPKEAKPPLPPEEPPIDQLSQNKNFNTQQQNFMSAPPPLMGTVTTPQIQPPFTPVPPVTRNQVPSNIRGKKPGGNFNYNQNRSATQVQHHDAPKNPISKPDSQGEKRPISQPIFKDPKKTKIEDAEGSGSNEDMSETEKRFVKQFTEWEAQFNKWKEQNMNHPDKEQYREYEKKWEAWRTQLLERREQMRKKRLGIADTKPSTKTAPISQTALAANLPPPFNKEINISKPPPLMQKDPFAPIDAGKDLGIAATSSAIKGPSADIFPEDNLEDTESDPLFKFSKTNDGIPGLDLVKDGAEDDKREDVIELDDEGRNKEMRSYKSFNENKNADISKVSNFEAISKGINNILGDQKLLNMLSMVSQNQTIQPTSSSIDTISRITTNTNFQYTSKNMNENSTIQSGNRWSNTNQQDYYNRNNDNDDHSRGSFGGRGSDYEWRDGYGGGNQNEFNSSMDQYGGNYEDGNFEQQEYDRREMFRGSDNKFRDSNNFRSQDNFRGNDNFQRPDGFRGDRGPGNNFRGPDNFKSNDNGFRGDNGPDNFRPPDNFSKPPPDVRGPEPFRNSNVRGPAFEERERRPPTFDRPPPGNNFGGRFEPPRGQNFDRNDDMDTFGNNRRPPGGGPANFQNMETGNNRGLDNNFRNFENEGMDFGRQQFPPQSNNFARGPNQQGGNYRGRAPPSNSPENKFGPTNFGRGPNDLNQPPNHQDGRGNFVGSSMGANNDWFTPPPADFNRNRNLMDNSPPMQTSDSFIPPGAPPVVENTLTTDNIEKPVDGAAPENIEAPLWQPTTIIEYDHKPAKTDDLEVSLEPLRTFDYRHKPVNRIPFPQRPQWLANQLKRYPEFDFLISRPYNQPFARYPERHDRFPDAGSRYENRWNNRDVPGARRAEPNNRFPKRIDDFNASNRRPGDDFNTNTRRPDDDFNTAINRRPGDDLNVTATRRSGDDFNGTNRKPGDDFNTNRRPGDDSSASNRWSGDDFNTSTRRPGDDFSATNRRSGEDFNTNTRKPGDDFSATNRRSGDNFNTNTRRPGNDFSATNRKPGDDFNTNTKRPGDDFNATNRKPGDDFNTNTRRPDDDFSATNRRSGDDFNANTRRSGDDFSASNRRAGDDFNTNARRPGDDFSASNRRSGDDFNTNTRRSGDDVSATNRRSGDDSNTNTRRHGDDFNAVARRPIFEPPPNYQKKDYDRKVERDYDKKGERDYDRKSERDYDRKTEKNYDRRVDKESEKDEDVEMREDVRERPTKGDHCKIKPLMDIPTMDVDDSSIHKSEAEKFLQLQNKPRTTTNVTLIQDILNPPGRFNRPHRIVIILRGPPGSGKTFLAKLIKDKEVENGGSAPRILSLDDYFMVEQEKEVEVDGKKTKVKEMVYEFEECMENAYRVSLFKAFKKTVTDGYFPFIIVDNVNDKVKYFGEMWSFAKQNGFQVYICQLEFDLNTCTKRNIHNRTESQIQKVISGWEPTPAHHPVLDATSLVQAGSIPEVEMEEINSPPSEDFDVGDIEDRLCRSKWDNFDCSIDNLAKLDGTNKPLRQSKTMEDYLQCDDECVTRESKPGQKRVRWADLEERKKQEKMRAIGFVVGQTNWDRMMDPTMGSSALTQTKYFERATGSRFYND